MLKDRVIKPLLVATEKVVEYYFPDEEQKKTASEVTEQKSKVPSQANENEGLATKPGTVNNDDLTSESSQ